MLAGFVRHGLSIVNGRLFALRKMILVEESLEVILGKAGIGRIGDPTLQPTRTSQQTQFGKSNNISSMTPNLSIPRAITQHFPT